MINIGTIIASAIFIGPSAIASGLHATGPAILVWVVGGVVSLLGALSVAELGAALPEAGGQYVYLTPPHGPIWGDLHGWTRGRGIPLCVRRRRSGTRTGLPPPPARR